MKKNRRLVCALLALLFCGTAVSCGERADEPESPAAGTPVSESPSVIEAEETAAPEETEPKPELPEKDCQGYGFVVLGGESYLERVLSEEMNGEVVNDAIFQANREVADAFNIKFEKNVVNDRDVNLIQSTIAAGQDDYDLICFHDCDTASMSLNGWFHNINALPYVDTEAAWWPRFTVDSLTINGKMLYFSNYISYNSSSTVQVAFFNSGLVTDYGLANPYDLVREGTWTVDRMADLTGSLYQDANGDGQRNEGDVFGLIAVNYPYRWAETFGIEAYKKVAPDSAELTLDINNESIVTLMEKLHNWFYSGDNGIWVDFDKDSSLSRGIFCAGSAVFTFDTVGGLTPLLLDTDINYGIVPYPKRDEAQADYYAGCNDRLFSVPITASDTERTGIIVEAMSYAGFKNILPAYVERTLQSRYATDEDCTEMLNLVIRNQVLSLSYLFANAVPNGMQFRIVYDTVKSGKFASWYQASEKKELKFMQKLTEFYSESEEP